MKRYSLSGGLVCLLMLLLVLLPAMAQAAELDDLRAWDNGERTRLVFDLSSEVKTDVFTLDTPDRLVIDFADTALDTELGSAISGSTLIRSIRSGIRQGNDLRVVMDLARPITPHAFKLAPGSGKGHRLVVDLGGSSKDREADELAAGGDGDPIEALIRQQERDARRKLGRNSPAADTAVAGQGGTSAAHRAAKPHPRRDIVVVIDPGHGGKDPGALGDRSKEKNVVLAIGRKLKAKFDAAPGFRAYMTRDNDTFIPLRGRLRIARERHADFFVSIHADAVGSSSPRGSSVYALSQHGATSETARWLAQTENRSDLIGGSGGDLSLEDKDRMLRGVLLDLSMTATINDSLAAGGDVIRQIAQFNRMHRSRVEQAAFVVLKSPDIPSLLVETGFITNPTEERLLNSSAHQQKLANAIFEGIRGHFRNSPPPDSLLAWQRDQRRGGAADEYRVRAGDTLSGIANSHDISLGALRRVNNLDSDVVRVGQVLTLP
ncbi:N-acetylmuramoyl-L-alanine amidase [Kushneria phosphatilytica]|uniref:N-acetylmuramoyl-L-alanine amidase AmiC n=1 Tax=Kushneria phosphatilytica TaxID=657387 RepID=A0A1S1NUT0_9GAMM|nr:N-acetylmuramoyl-L-alanine amidase [Kushneria phosphatilytica]OHV09967.1 N-acetylmuramoyl-L-alanine amidase [Kushneria phosphatilytica]QEL11647.1 AMIN domain-containing protein [Kushneria phosphatilytica]